MELNQRIGIARSRRGGGGLILMVLIAMAIVLVLYFGNLTGGGSYMQQVAKTRQKGLQTSVQLNTQQLMTMIVQHKLATDRLPQNVDELGAPPGAFADPWGQPITFEYEVDSAGSQIVVFSSPGPDGEPGTADDIIVRERLPL